MKQINIKIITSLPSIMIAYITNNEPTFADTEISFTGSLIDIIPCATNSGGNIIVDFSNNGDIKKPHQGYIEKRSHCKFNVSFLTCHGN